MSKIFDALRKAEKSKRKTGSQAKKIRKPASKSPESKESAFLSGLDEDFRRSLMTLRNSVDSEMRDKGTRIIMFASALPGEGKTTVSTFLARLMSASDMEKTLLVDCAVRNPQIGKLFGIKKGKGIVEYLLGEAEAKDIVRPVERGILDVVTTRTVKEENIVQPLFHSERMRDFLIRMAEHYDYILVDSSSILNAPETTMLSPFMDGIIMVIQAGRTKREVINRAIMRVNKQGGTFIGSVLNRKKYHIPEFIYRRV